jgi:hypothetical protein
LNYFYFKENIDEKLFGKKHCPVDHKNRARMQKDGADHQVLDLPMQHKQELIDGNISKSTSNN